jgi:hypothetical protein
MEDNITSKIKSRSYTCMQDKVHVYIVKKLNNSNYSVTSSYIILLLRPFVIMESFSSNSLYLRVFDRRVPHPGEYNHQTDDQNQMFYMYDLIHPNSIMKPKVHHTITIHAQTSRQQRHTQCLTETSDSEIVNH